MKQLNLPRKYTVTSQLFISVGLIILAAIFAFTPLLTLDLSENKAKNAINEAIESLNDEIDADVDFEIPDKIDVSMPKLVTSISIFTKVIGVIADGAASDDDEALAKAEEELNEILASEKGQETLTMLVGLIVGTINVDIFDADDIGDNIGTVVNLVIGFCILFYLLALSFIWPVVLIITAIVTLIKALRAWKKGENVATKFGAGLIGALGTVVGIALLMTFVPNLVLGSGLIAILVLSIISIAVNIAASRLRAYNDVDFKYANIVQGTALLKLVGVIVFITSVLKTGFLRGFIDSMSTYVVNAAKNVSNINDQIDLLNASGEYKHIARISMNMGYLLELGLMLLAALFALSICKSLVKSVAAQLGLVAKKKTSKPGSLANGIIALIICVIPVVVSKLENKIFYTLQLRGGDGIELVEEVEGSIFKISNDGEAALTGMFVGAALILASSIAYLVLKAVFCKGMTKEQQNLVLTGNAPLVEEAVAEEAPAEEAPAEEAPAEEAPAEEAPAEEAVAEEAPAEEAPAEEAVAEEAVAEEAPTEE